MEKIYNYYPKWASYVYLKKTRKTLLPLSWSSKFINLFFVFLSLLLFMFASQTSMAQTRFWHRYSSIDSNYNFNGSEYGQTVHQLQSGNYLVTGNAPDSVGNPSGYIKKINPYGMEIWSKKFDDNLGFTSSVLTDGGTSIAISAYKSKQYGSNTNNTPQILKCDTSGGTLWNYEYADSTTGYFGRKIIESQNNGAIDGLVLLSYIDFYGFMLTKVNANDGSVIFSKKYDAGTPSVKFLSSIIQSSDGNYNAVGSYGGHCYMLKVDSSDGSIIWDKNYNLLSSITGNAFFTDIIEAPFNGSNALVATLGVIRAGTFPCDTFPTVGGVMIISTNGDTVIDARITCDVQYNKIIYARDTFYLTGINNSEDDAYVAKFKTFTNITKTKYTYSFGGLKTSFTDLSQTSDSGFVMTGYATGSVGRTYCDLQKTDMLLSANCGQETVSLIPYPVSAIITAPSLIDTSFQVTSSQTSSIKEFNSFTESNCVNCDPNTSLTLTQSAVPCKYVDSIKLTAASTYKYFFYVWTNLSTGDSTITFTDTFWAKTSGGYNVTGRYNWFDCKKTSKAVLVKFYPKITAGFYDSVGACSDIVTFFDTSTISSGSIIMKYWHFGDPASGLDSIGYGDMKNHLFSDTGYFTVRLIVVGDNGCPDTAYKSVHITGQNPYPLTITSSGSNWSKVFNNIYAVINPSPAPQYSIFRWYRSGYALDSGCNCQGINTKYPGTYILQALGDCGWETSNEIELKPLCDDYLNQSLTSARNIPAGFYNDSNGYHIAADITVNNGDTAEFSNTFLIIDDCVKITVKEGGTLLIDSSIVSSCSNWQGIVVENGGSGRGHLKMTSSHLSYATLGILARNGGQIYIGNDTFENNYAHIGVAASSISNQDSVRIGRCMFGRVRYNFTDSTYTCGHDDWVGSFSYPNLAGDTDIWRPLVFIDSAEDVLVTQNLFAIDVFYRPNPPGSTLPINLFNGRVGLLSQNTRKYIIRENDFYGTNQYSVLMKNTPDYASKFEGNIINGGGSQSISNQLMCGALIENGDSLVVYSNQFNTLHRGLEMYGAGNYPDTVKDNRFENNTYGLAIAPNEWPLTSDTTQNKDTSLIKVQIHCNKFTSNTIAIGGSGNLQDQLGINHEDSADVGNAFTYTTDWDFIWQDNDTSLVRYYTSNNSDTPNHNVNKPIIDINSYKVANSNFIRRTQLDTLLNPFINDNYCRAFLKTSNAHVGMDKTEVVNGEKVWVYPNPFNGRLYVRSKDELSKGRVIVFDVMGRRVLEQAITGTEAEISTSHFSAGFYIIKIVEGNTVVHTQKLIKAEQ